MNGMFHNGNLLQWSDSSRAPSLAQEFPIRQQFLRVQFRPSLHQPPLSFEVPVLKGFNFAGGSRVIPEFVALTVALSTYTAAFIAEIVRAGILSVHRGQMEAGSSLGLHRGSVLRLIVIPQAMRVILPPLTNQYLNLTKNSSLAVAIGYPDLVSVFAGTTLSQTGQAIEIIGITMGVYLLISLVTSAIMSFYGWRLGRSLER